jgi:hydroxymethylpyrimidine pyrophosphatase-like HAD family hydrolase
VKLVATDLDGTLVHSDGTITPRSREVLRALQDRGVIVVFVTGRPLRWARDVFDDVGEHGMAIVSNGALLWDVTNDRSELVRAVPVEAGVAACERIRRAVPGSVFATESLDGIALEPGFLERYQLPEGSRRGGLEEIFPPHVLKILARHEELEPQDFWDRAADAVGDDLEIVWSSATTLLEMSAAGVTKASTLEIWAGSHGIESADVIAFGDMPNDIPMLRWAGTSYAMANAHPSVRAAADHVAGHHDEDGVAQVLEGLLQV